MKKYHYTVGWHNIASILESKIIEKEKQYYDDQKNVVWFSANPVWENTVKKTGGIGIAAHAQWGCFRFAINDNVEVYNYQHYRQNTHEKKSILNKLEKSAISWGASPYDWFYSPNHITLDKVDTIGIYVDGTWCDYSVAAFKDKYAYKITMCPIKYITNINGDYDLSSYTAEVLQYITDNGISLPLSLYVIDNTVHCVYMPEIQL